MHTCLVWLVVHVVLGSALGATHPHLVFVLLHDWGRNCSGSDNFIKVPTPHIDRLVGEGIEFQRHGPYSGVIECAPSRWSSQSGRLTFAFGATTNSLSDFSGTLRSLGSTAHMTSEQLLGTDMDMRREIAMSAQEYPDDLANSALDILARHSPADQLFLFHSIHLLVGQSQCGAMALRADTTIGTVVQLLQHKGMWGDTLIFVSCHAAMSSCSDSDGAEAEVAAQLGATRDCGSCLRSRAFVSGGALPVPSRGSKLDDLLHMPDWHATLLAIAGLAPKGVRATEAEMGGVDQSRLFVRRGEREAGAPLPPRSNRVPCWPGSRIYTQ